MNAGNTRRVDEVDMKATATLRRTCAPARRGAAGRPGARRGVVFAAAWLAAHAGLFAVGCGSDGDARGTVVVFVEPEDSIPEGVEPGTGDEQIVDGWKVDYSAFTIVIGNLRAGRSADSSASLRDPSLTMVNLLDVPGGGLVLHTFDDVAAVRWDRFGFDLAKATAEVGRADGVSDAEFARLVSAGASLHVAGTITKPGGQSCKPGDAKDCVAAAQIRFDWLLAVPTSFDDCAPPTGDAGFAVPAGGTVQIKPTIHGDHWFFSNVTQGAEITTRRGQWLADADLDRDGETTLQELAATKAATLFPAGSYNLSGALVPIVTGLDFVQAQARTLGDFQGEGECPTRKAL